MARGAQIVDVDRGGDITFHGPGQLVAYPIVDLRARGIGPTDYVRSLERALLVTLDEFGVAGALVRGKPGIWVDGAKIAARNAAAGETRSYSQLAAAIGQP